MIFLFFFLKKYFYNLNLWFFFLHKWTILSLLSRICNIIQFKICNMKKHTTFSINNKSCEIVIHDLFTPHLSQILRNFFFGIWSSVPDSGYLCIMMTLACLYWLLLLKPTKGIKTNHKKQCQNQYITSFIKLFSLLLIRLLSD